MRSAHLVTAEQIAQIDQQNDLVAGDPSAGRYGVCTTPYEPSNPSGADDTVKYGRNVLRGIVDAANASRRAPDAEPSPSVIELASTYINAEVFESVVFESWATIVANTIAAKTAWERS